jgi:hypothetical protein
MKANPNFGIWVEADDLEGRSSPMAASRWPAGCPPTRRSPDLGGNLKPAKDKSTERIDGIVVLIMAIGRARVAQEQPQPEYSLFFV